MKAATCGLLLHDVGVGVDEERAGQRVLAGVHGFSRGRHAFDRQVRQLALVLLEVGEAEVADGVLVAFDALHQDVVVFGQLRLAAPSRLPHPYPCQLRILDIDRVHHRLDEVVEGAAVGAGAEALDRLGRPAGFTSDQFVSRWRRAWPAPPSSHLRPIQSFSGFTTTARASVPTRNSTGVAADRRAALYLDP